MSNGIAGPASSETITGVKLLELNDYDRQRKSHPVIIDETMIKLGTRTLSTEITCPICLDLFTSTMGTKECLHRFCSECINTALLRNNRECPTCRKKIVSKRSLRNDCNLDGLINKLWPERKLYDELQNVSMQHYHQETSVASLQKSIEAGIKAQAQNRRQRVIGSYDFERKKRKRKNPNGDEEPNSPSQDDESLESQNNGEEENENTEVSDTDDTSSLSSTISDSSELDSLTTEESRDMSVEPNSSQAPQLERLADLNIQQEDETRSPLMISNEIKEIELELAPSRPFRKREDLAPPIKKSRFIKVDSNCTMSHLGAYLKQAAKNDLQESNSTSDLSGTVVLEPKYFYYLTANYQIEQAEGSITVGQIHLFSPISESHLRLIYDSQPHDETQRDATIGTELEIDLDPDPDEDPDYPGY